MINWNEEIIGEDGDIYLFRLSGELGSETCDYLYVILAERIGDGARKLVLECDDLRIISSMGLGLLMRVHSKMKKLGGDVKLVRVHGAVATAFKLVMLDKVLSIYPSVRAAMESYT